MSIRVVLVDDHHIMRKGLKALLEKYADISVVGEAGNGRDALGLIRKTDSDVVVMDVSMPDMNGIEATRQIKEESPFIKVIALSMHSDKLFVEGMLKAGVSGYLLKDCLVEDLANAICTVIKGEIYLSPKIAATVVKTYLHQLANSNECEQAILTPRERETLQLIAEGRDTKQIASRLHVSTKTVEIHRRKIMEKLDLHSIAELTKYAIREGLTGLESF